MNNTTFEVTITKDQGTTVKQCNHTVSERQKQGRSQRVTLNNIYADIVPKFMVSVRGTQLIAMAGGNNINTTLSCGCDLT